MSPVPSLPMANCWLLANSMTKLDMTFGCCDWTTERCSRSCARRSMNRRPAFLLMDTGWRISPTNPADTIFTCSLSRGQEASGKSRQKAGRSRCGTATGEKLFYRSGDKMMAVDVTTQPSFFAGKPKMLFQGPYLPTTNYASLLRCFSRRPAIPDDQAKRTGHLPDGNRCRAELV